MRTLQNSILGRRFPQIHADLTANEFSRLRQGKTLLNLFEIGSKRKLPSGVCRPDFFGAHQGNVCVCLCGSVANHRKPLISKFKLDAIIFVNYYDHYYLQGDQP